MDLFTFQIHETYFLSILDESCRYDITKLLIYNIYKKNTYTLYLKSIKIIYI